MNSFYISSKPVSFKLTRLLLIATFVLLSMIKLNAQVATSYTFNSTLTLPYTYITGGTVYGTSNDDDNYYIANIGFSYNYNGVSFTTLWVDANGFITFGNASTPPTSTYYFGPPLQYNTNCIAAFSNDLQGDSLPNSEMRVQTIGVSPFRTCVVQWRDWGEYGAAGVNHPSTSQIYNFQIRLNENNGNGSIDVIYGGFATNTTPYNSLFQAGINSSPTDFNNRTSSTGWSSTTAGTLNSSSVSFSTILKPDSGRTFSWVIPPAPMVMDSFTTIQSTAGVLQNTASNPIVAAVVYTHGTSNPKIISQLSFNTAGTNRLLDVTNAKVFYTGTNSNYSPAAVINQFGATITSPSGAMTYTGIDTLLPGANYFWLTYTTSATAVIGDTLDGTCTNIVDSIARSHTPNVTAPAGFVKIILPLSGNYTINPAAIASSTNFTSFDNALAALLLNGVSGPVKLTVSAGTYTLLSALSIGNINGASSINTITFDGVSAASTTLTGNLNSPILMLNLCKYVIIRNFTVTNTFAGSCAGITILGSSLINYGTGCAIKKCIINLPNVASSTSAGIGLTTDVLGYTFSTSVLMDSVQIDSNVINGGYYGVGIFGALSVAFNRGMKFRGNTLNNIYYYGMFIYYVQNALDVTNNTINMLSGTGYYGMYLASCTNNTNISHNFSGNTINNFYYYGMYISTPGGISAAYPVKIYNNTISSGSTNAYNCIYLTTTGYSEVYHNTLVFNFNTATTTYGPMNFTGGTTINIMNNIFDVNVSAGSATCLYLSTNPVGNVVTHNNYYNKANTSLVNRGGIVYTPSTYINVAGGGDSSFNVLPAFVSATDFHLADACSPKGANLLSLVPQDIDGQTRSASPNIGSDEVISVTNDIAVVSITQPYSPVSPGLSDLMIKVRNTGSTAITSFTISYKNNSGTLQTQNWIYGTLNPCDTAIVLFTGLSQINLTSINNVLIYTSAPNGLTDNNKLNDTLRTTLFGPMNGSFTIGASGANFTSFTSAISAMQSAGLSGPVTFNVLSGTYNEQVLINGPITGASPTNTITFDGGNGNAASRIITGSASGAGPVSQGTVIITNSKYISFRNLTIQNNSTIPVGFAIVGAASTYNSGANSISKCIVTITPQTGTSSTGYGIIATASANGYGLAAMGADSITIDSNTVTGGGYGITVYGQSSTTYNRNIKVRGNNVTTNYAGGYIAYNYNAIDVLNNTFNMSSTYGAYGLYFYYNQNASTTVPHQIIGNRVNNFGQYGLYVYYPASLTTTAVTKVYNNMAWAGSGTTYPGYYGIYLYQALAAVTEIYHNTVNMAGNTASTTYTCFYNTGSANTFIRNNNFIVSAGLATPMYLVTSVAGNNANFNNYYNFTNPTTGSLVYRGGFYNPTNFLSATAGGDTSYNVAPVFTQIAIPCDLHITNSCAIRGADLSAYVPTDIDGETRGIPGQIGCDDYPTNSLDLMIDALLSPAYPISSGLQNVRVRVRNNGANTITSLSLAYKLNGGTAVVLSPAWSGALVACDTTSLVFTGAQQVNIVSNTINTLKVYTYNPNGGIDLNKVNDTVTATVATPMVGTYTIGATGSDYTTFATAIAALQLRGVGGNVIFNVKSGTYTGPINLTSVVGASASSTITFKSLANNADSVIIIASAPTDGYIVSYTNATYTNLKYLTISSTTISSTQNGVNIIGTSSYDSIANCKITMAVQTSYGNYIIYATGLGISSNGFVFKNNILSGSYYGIYLYGTSQANPYMNYVIDGNTIQNTYYYSMYTYYSNGLVFNNNTITPSATLSGHIIYFMYADTIAVTNNKFNLTNNTTMYLGYYWRGGPNRRSLAANNVITGTPTVTSPTIYLGYQSTNTDYYHNSINVPSTTQAAYIYNSGALGQNIKNNVFANTGTGSAAYFSALPAASTVVMDYNNYYTAGATLISGISPQTTVAAWKIACNCDKGSLNYRPGFTSSLNLTPNPADSAVWSLNGRALNVSSIVPLDVNGVARPASLAVGVPDIGAYEVTPSTLPPLATANPAVTAPGVTQTFTFGGDTVAKIAWDINAFAPSNFSVRQYPGVRPPKISLLNTYMYFYADMSAATGYYNSTISLYYKDAWMGTCPAKVDLRLAQKSTLTTIWNPYTYTASTVDTTRGILNANVIFDLGYFTGTDNNNPLPVTLADAIRANKSGKDVIVSWTTASEINSSRFEVERSQNGTSFELAGTVKAIGNSNTMHLYSFNDKNIVTPSTNVIYYRLKMIDNDGKFTYSQVVMVRIDKLNGQYAVSVYPNPFKGEISISVNATIAEKATVSVFDINGKLMHQTATAISKGDQVILLNELSALENGVYFVKIHSDNINETIKVVKAN